MTTRGHAILGVILTLSSCAGPVTFTPPDGPFPYTVTSVTDGDTIKVRHYTGEESTVRIIGIDTPETKHPTKPVMCGGKEATAFAHSKLDGQKVSLITDSTQDVADHFGRTIAYVEFVQGNATVDYGLEAVRAGMAATYVYSAPYVRLPAYKAAHEEARAEGRGFWAQCQGRIDLPAEGRR